MLDSTEDRSKLTIKLKIADAMEGLPFLNTEGLNLVLKRGMTLDEEVVELDKRKEKLLEDTGEFEKTVEWLKQIKKIKSLNRSISSYGLKHIVEKDIGYITNGTLIAAAVHSGFYHKSCQLGGLNAFFNMSNRSINEADRRRHKNSAKP